MTEMKKTKKMSKIETAFGEPLEQLLQRLYWEEQLPISGVGEYLGIPEKTVRRWMLRLGIKGRSVKQAANTNKCRQKRKHMTQQLWEEGRYQRGTLQKTVEAKYDAQIEVLLQRWYLDEQLSLSDIACKLGVSRAPIVRWMKQAGIERRTTKAATNTSKYRQKRAEIEKRKWQNGAYRKRHSEMRKQYCSGEKYRREFSDRMKQYWRDETFRRKTTKAIKRRWEDEDFRARWRKSHKAAISSREYRESAAIRMKQLWQDDEFVMKVFDGINRRPNIPESLINTITPSNIKYTGDGSFWRTLPSGRHSNPDFIVEPIEKTRKVIYHHGIFWHRDELHDRGETLINLWKEIGYDCLVIWQDELADLDKVLAKIADFIGQDTWQLNIPFDEGE